VTTSVLNSKPRAARQIGALIRRLERNDHRRFSSDRFAGGQSEAQYYDADHQTAHRSHVPRYASNPGCLTKVDVAIAELGTDLGTEHRENDAHKRDMVEQAGRLNVR